MLFPWVTLPFLAGVLLTLAPLRPPATRPGFVLTALAPWAIPCFALALVGYLCLSLLGLRRTGTVLALVAAAGLALQLAWIAPAYVGSHPQGPADLTVMQLNMRHGDASAADTVRLAERNHADVVSLEELTPEAMQELIGQGIFRDYPHRTGIPVFGKFGIGIFSRYPLTRIRQLPVSAGAFLMRVHAPRPFWLIAAHLGQPTVDLATWYRDLGALTRVAGRLRGPRVVVGDLNATLDHAPVRWLLDTGLTDAARQANSGWQPTWPGARGPSPFRGLGLVQIDHVLVGGGIGAVSTSTTAVPGTDHRALLAELRTPSPHGAHGHPAGGVPFPRTLASEMNHPTQPRSAGAPLGHPRGPR